MKKISLFALALSSSLAMFAQNNVNTTPMAVKTRFGIKAGVNLADFILRDWPNGTSPTTEKKTSMNGGFFANVPLGTGGLAVQPEILYMGEGSKLSTQTTVGTVTTTNRYEQDLSYIAIPIMIQWKSKGGFIVETGPQAGYLVRAQQQTEGMSDTENQDNFDNFDFSWAGGLGYLSRIGLGINARYNFGLRDIMNDTNNANAGSGKLKNQVISIGLSYSFGAAK